jgi:hypothetical protein
MKDKINRDLKQYYQLGDNRGQSNLSSAKQTILELLTFKYSQMCENKRIIQANNEFLNMAKIRVESSWLGKRSVSRSSCVPDSDELYVCGH